MCLLNAVGTLGLELYNIFTWIIPRNEVKLDKVLEKFHTHCNPLKNEMYERHIFKCRVQKDGETIDQFATELH